MTVPNITIMTPINLPSLSSLILLATRAPDTDPTTAAEPATSAALKTISLLRICPIDPEPEMKNIIRREVPIAV